MTDDLWDVALRYSEYEKGAMYSVSDILADPLMVALRLENPHHNEMKTKNMTSANIGSACHSHWERALDASECDVQTEVKLKYKNLSGTADIVFPDGMIADWKTGKDTNIKAKLKDPTKWIQQLSLYSYLLYKGNGVPMNAMGRIYWLETTKGNYGVVDYDLLSEAECLELIKEFMENMKKPSSKLPQCNLCLQFMHNWCNQSANCPKWGLRERYDNEVEDW